MQTPQDLSEIAMADLRANMKVRYKADPSTVGWVVSVAGESARVFIADTTKLVPVAELEPAPSLVEMSPDKFRNTLTQRRLEHPLTDQLLSYKASRTDLYYHQFLPVKKMLESPDQRLLIADEVGTGKTIEAGLIWAELESREAYGLENVWIICPKSLVGKWQEEMLHRFDLRVESMSSQDLRQALVSLERDGVLPPRFAKTVVNLELIRAEEHAARLGQTAIAWDLVIFDEAHHLRNPETLSHALAVSICERSKTALFLSATPLQTSLSDIVHLMEALGVDVAAAPRLLEEQMRWDMELNDWIRLVRNQPPGWQKEMDRMLYRLEVKGGRDRPGWIGFRQLVSESDMEDRAQRTVVVEAARDLQALSPYMTRTLRSDVDADRPTREAITRNVEFSPEEKAFYDRVYGICLERASTASAPPGFITQMPERRTASCVPAVASEILGYAAEDEDEEARARFTQEEVVILKPLAQAALRSTDRKLEALCEILEHSFRELKSDRVMVFSTFRGTLNYLAKELDERGYSHELMYGPTPPRDEDCRRDEKSRERIGAEFRRGKFQILLASEVAGEGLDFEHCHIVINYDLPWNPMRVEQRIGRCDRIGQRSDKVHVGSLASIGTIEQRILSRLYERLNVFERALGDMEVILGEHVAAFEREVFSHSLSPQQQLDRLERISQAVENREHQRESVTQSGVISEQGRQLIESDQDEIKDAEAKFLSPEEVAEFVYASLDSHLPKCVKRTLAKEQFEVSGTEEMRDALQGLLRTYSSTHYARTEIVRFRKRLDEQKKIRVSFSGHGDNTEFVHTRHPLVLLARNLVDDTLNDIPYCSGMVPAGVVDEPIMLVWAVGSLEGYTNRAEILCVTVNCATSSVHPVTGNQAQELTYMLSPFGDGRCVDIDVADLLTQAEHTLLAQFDGLGKVFNSRNNLLAEKARQATISHASRKLDWLERQLARGNIKNNIRNLYHGWRRNIEAETQSKLNEIEKRSQVRSSLEIIGVVAIHPENP